MDAPEHPEVDLDALLVQIRQRADERRRSGEYPPGLEHDLDVHFRHIVEHRPVRDLDSLHRAMASFESGLTFDPASIPTGSRVPGGELLHRAVSKAVTRQAGWLAQQLQDFAESVRVVLWKMVETLDSPTHVHAELTAELDAVLDRLAYYERAPADAAMLGSILRRLEALEAAQVAPWAVASPELPAGALSLEVAAERLAGYEPSVVLALAQAAPELARTEPASLGGLALLGGLDGMSEEELAGVFGAAAASLRPGGIMVLDSPGPLHPAQLAFLCREAGFSEVAVEWRPPPPAPGTHCTLTAVR